jgi:hypothetical protein
MLRRSHILTAVAVLAMCVVPGIAYGMPDQPVAPDQPSPPPSSIAQSTGQSYSDLRSPDARDAGEAAKAQIVQDLRSPDARDAKTEPVTQVAQDLRSPDARDAKTEPVTQLAQDLRSPDARDAAQAAKVEVPQDLRSPDARDAGLPESPTPDTVVEIREVPSTGFDWGDAGIGAAGILALLSIAGGLALMVTTRRRREGTEMPAH